MSKEHHITQTMVPLSFEYHYRVGPFLEQYINALAEGKLMGGRCGSCGRVMVPPRQVCGRCNAEIEEIVDAGIEGTLVNFTVGRVNIQSGQIADAKEPYLIGHVKLDRGDSLLMVKLNNVKPGEVTLGTRVRAVFSKEPQGTIHDLLGFEPLG